jgi:energy-coupling factor transporter ATP-binding protein EcfA2
MTQPVLELIGLSKSFAATQALKDMSLSVMPGEVHAIVGENGAGKSTLIKIMTGVHQPDTGTIRVEGQPVTYAPPSPRKTPASPRSTRNRWSSPTSTWPRTSSSRTAPRAASCAGPRSMPKPLPDRPPWRQTRRPPRRLGPHARRTADRRNRPRPLAQGQGPHHGRTHGEPLRPRGRPPPRHRPRAEGTGRRRHLHLPPPGRDLPHRRPRHRDPRRPAHQHQAHSGGHRRRPGQGHGRPRAGKLRGERPPPTRTARRSSR